MKPTGCFLFSLLSSHLLYAYTPIIVYVCTCSLMTASNTIRSTSLNYGLSLPVLAESGVSDFFFGLTFTMLQCKFRYWCNQILPKIIKNINFCLFPIIYAYCTNYLCVSLRIRSYLGLLLLIECQCYNLTCIFKICMELPQILLFLCLFYFKSTC